MPESTISAVNQNLASWVDSTIPNLELTFQAPGDRDGNDGVSLYLMEFLPAVVTTAAAKKRAHQFQLRYLVSSWGDDAGQAQQNLSTLIFSAMENPDFQIDLEPISSQLWLAFGITPRPAFLLQLPLTLKRKEYLAPIIRYPLEIQQSSIVSLQGVVLGPEDIPVAQAKVEIPAYQLNTTTDSNGRFKFNTVPETPVIKKLKIKARNRVLEIEAKHDTKDAKPLIIHFDVMEL